MHRHPLLVGPILLSLVLAACSSAPRAVPAAESEPPSLLGEVSREQIEAAEPGWVSAQVESGVDVDAALALAEVEPGAAVTVYLGTWCSDSRRELARFWRALDETAGLVSFDVRYVAVDRREKRPPEMERDLGLRYVPTFIVERDGREVGRMVEVSLHGIEKDLLALLTGETEGVVTARDDSP